MWHAEATDGSRQQVTTPASQLAHTNSVMSREVGQCMPTETEDVMEVWGLNQIYNA